MQAKCNNLFIRNAYNIYLPILIHIRVNYMFISVLLSDGVEHFNIFSAYVCRAFNLCVFETY